MVVNRNSVVRREDGQLCLGCVHLGESEGVKAKWGSGGGSTGLKLSEEIWCGMTSRMCWWKSVTKGKIKPLSGYCLFHYIFWGWIIAV